MKCKSKTQGFGVKGLYIENRRNMIKNGTSLAHYETEPSEIQRLNMEKLICSFHMFANVHVSQKVLNNRYYYPKNIRANVQ